MNRYRVWYTYTEPSEDCPEVLVTGAYIDTVDVSHQAAKKYINTDSYLNRMKENLRVVKSKLLEKDIHLLKRKTVEGKKQIEGFGASFKLDGEEIVVSAKSKAKLQSLGVKLFGKAFSLNTDQVKQILITQK